MFFQFHCIAVPTNLPEVSTKHLLGFVYDLAPHWDLIGHGLGVGDVVRLLQRNARGADSLCMEMFARWIERSPDANWRTLVKVLARLQMDRVVKKIVDYLHQSQSVDHCEQFSPECKQVLCSQPSNQQSRHNVMCVSVV